MVVVKRGMGVESRVLVKTDLNSGVCGIPTAGGLHWRDSGLGWSRWSYYVCSSVCVLGCWIWAYARIQVDDTGHVVRVAAG